MITPIETTKKSYFSKEDYVSYLLITAFLLSSFIFKLFPIVIAEMLIAMVLLEAIFGPIGVVLAPVIYGYIKEELKLKGVI